MMTRALIVLAAVALLLAATGCVGVVSARTCPHRQLVSIDGKLHVVNLERGTARPVEFRNVDPSVETIEVIETTVEEDED